MVGSKLESFDKNESKVLNSDETISVTKQNLERENYCNKVNIYSQQIWILLLKKNLIKLYLMIFGFQELGHFNFSLKYA